MGQKLLKKKSLLFLNFISEKRQAQYLRFLLRIQTKSQTIGWTALHQKVKNALFVLPEDPLFLLMQIPNLQALLSQFEAADKKLFCSGETASLFEGLSGFPPVLSYLSEDLFLFSQSSAKWIRTLREENFDTCFYLDTKADLKKFFLCAKSEIPLRITYAQELTSFFFNLTIRPQTEAKFLGEQNLSLARCLGSEATMENFRFHVDREALQRTSKLLLEMGIGQAESIIGLSSLLDSSLLERLLPVLFEHQKKVILLSFPGKNQTRQKHSFSSLAGQVYVCPPLPLAESAAILRFCDYFISEPSSLLYLSHYVGTPVVALLDKKTDKSLWTIDSPSFQTVLLEGNAEAIAADTIEGLKQIHNHEKRKSIPKEEKWKFFGAT